MTQDFQICCVTLENCVEFVVLHKLFGSESLPLVSNGIREKWVLKDNRGNRHWGPPTFLPQAAVQPPSQSPQGWRRKGILPPGNVGERRQIQPKI